MHFSPSLTRRFSLAGAAGLAAATAVAPSAKAQGNIDVDILNLALNLEYLEAEFYLRAAFGVGLADADIGGTGTLGAVTGGTQVTFTTPAIRDYAIEIAEDERNHVQFLRKALGSAAVARPKIDLAASFTNAARAAGLVGPSDTFNPFANETAFLLGAFIFEDVGVTAYKGAAPLITDKGVLEAAAGILAVEAYHAGEIRLLLFQRGLFLEAQKISDLRDGADGPGDKDQGVRRAGRANIVPTDRNGLAYSRSVSEVLNIVYLGGADANFGFFPDRLNGTFN